MKAVKSMFMFAGLALASSTLVAANAAAEMVVIVSEKNPNSTITAGNAEKIFLGKIKLFPDGSSAIPLDLPNRTEEKDYFYAKAIRKNSAQLKAYWAKVVFTGGGAPPKSVDSQDEMVKLVAQNPNTIGYVEKSKIDPSVKVVLQVP